MDMITTTNLRTQSSAVIALLKKGTVISLIHRSKIVGIIKPQKEPKVLTKTDSVQIQEQAKKLRLPSLSYEKREKQYREHLEKKYGKSLS